MRSLGYSRVGLTPGCFLILYNNPTIGARRSLVIDKIHNGVDICGLPIMVSLLISKILDVCNAPRNLIVIVDLGQCASQENARGEPQDNPWKLVPAGPRLRNSNHRYPEFPFPGTGLCQEEQGSEY